MKYLYYLMLGLRSVTQWTIVICAVFIALKVTKNLYSEYSYQTVQKLDSLPPFQEQDAYEVADGRSPALIRLHKDISGEKDRFFCSGFVISNDYAMTAAHCLVDEVQTLITADIKIHEIHGLAAALLGKAVAVNITSDLGLIQGDFHKFSKLRIPTTPGAVMEGLGGGPFVTCGFPYGDADLCVPFSPKGNFYNFIFGLGFLAPGMSGGPVLSLGSMYVVGVNSSTMDGRINIAPIIGILHDAGVDKP